MTALDASLALECIDQGQWRAHADPKREANSGMFGGWTAALLLKGVLDDPRAEGAASAITVHFIGRVEPGSVLRLRTDRLGGSRSVAHWRSDLWIEGKADLAATATIVLANRRESDQFTEAQFPAAPPPEALPMFHPPGSFGQTMEMRIVGDGNPFSQPTTRSLAWERETSGRPMDALQLVYLSDVGWPRVFALSPGPRPSSTITMSVYIHATPGELAACGDDYILSDMIGTRIEHSTTGSRAQLWSRLGPLLATTEQLCWFR
jgi:acyl-CoA thioesterase